MTEAVERFSEFIEDSFKDGIVLRELRLSDSEAEHLKKEYPGASLRRLPEEVSTDGKAWYEVEFLPK